ncbi:HEAT repeat domain-containing protein [bacterium]|nr:HEAT repeat domain-containing protein [bacterium]
MNKGWKDIKEGDRVWLSVAFVDMVGSTNLYKEVGENEAKRRKELFRAIAERVFGKFGTRTEWHGEGAPFFFTKEDDVVKASIDFIAEIRVRGIRDIEAEIVTRISIASGLTEFKEELGKMDAHFISLGGHINSAAPENSILITEDVYDALPEELKNKFGLCGTTRRDNVTTFIYSKEKRSRKNPGKFLPDEEETAFGYRKYLDGVKKLYEKLAFFGVRQMSRIPLLDLTKVFFPLKVRKKETKFRIAEKWDKGPTLLRMEEGIESYSESVPHPFPDVFKKEKHLIVLGDPGSGKTTLLKWLSLIYCQGIRSSLKKDLTEERLLPLLIPISALFEKKENRLLPDAVSESLKEFSLEFSASLIKKKMEEGKCLILLDGLDEISKKTDRFEMARYIERAINAFPKNRFVITSRIIGYEEIQLPGGATYTISGLEKEEIGLFARRWFTEFESSLKGEAPSVLKRASEAADELVGSIETSPIFDLAKNPFLLTLICLVYVAGQRLPRSRVRLYLLCCETLFETWTYVRSLRGKKTAEPIEYEEGERILAPLALWMHEESPGGLAEEEGLKEKLIEIMMKERDISQKEARGFAKEFFDYLGQTTQLLIHRGAKRWGFMHRTFEEFLAAVALYKEDRYFEYLKDKSYDSNWREVFLLLCGYINLYGKKSEIPLIIEELTSRKDDLESILHKNLLLTGEMVADLGLKDRLADQIIDEVISLALRSEYSTLRKEATEVLKKGRDLSVGRLSEILVDKEEVAGVRQEAALALGKIGEKESIPVLTSVLEDKEEDGNVRQGAALALVKLDQVESIPVLTSILKDKKEDKWARQGAAWVLGEIGGEEATSVLTSILKDKGENKYVRQGAALVLGKIGQVESIPVLTSIIKDKKEDKWARQEAAKALGKMGKADEEVVSILREIADQREEDLYIPARFSVTKLGLQIKGVKEPIIKELKNPSLDPYKKNFLFAALRWLSF